MNGKNKTTMLCQIISQIIKEGHITGADEAEIRKVLNEEAQESKKEGGQCLAEIVEEEIIKLVEKAATEGKADKSSIKLYRPVIDGYFWKTETGTRPATELSENEIRRFIMQAGKEYERDKNNMTCFMGLLQAGLNRMAEDNMINFAPDKHLYRDYLSNERGIIYIYNPYAGEIERIREWIEKHLGDIRGLAVGLWFTGDISAAQIASLKKEDCGKGILKKEERARFIAMALKLHPENGEYVFMTRKDGNWKKLMGRSLQTKLYYICEDLEIEYKKIHRDEAFICKE